MLRFTVSPVALRLTNLGSKYWNLTSPRKKIWPRNLALKAHLIPMDRLKPLPGVLSKPQQGIPKSRVKGNPKYLGR